MFNRIGDGISPGEFEEELRAEASDAETDSETARLRSRTLADATEELSARGDRVRVACGRHSLVGRLTVAVHDLAILDAGETEATVHLAGPVTIALVEESTAGGVTVRDSAPSFKARLFEFELSGEPVTVLTEFAEEHGVIGTVAKDHVVLDRGAGEMYVPIRMIGMVTRPSPPSPGWV